MILRRFLYLDVFWRVVRFGFAGWQVVLYVFIYEFYLIIELFDHSLDVAPGV